MNDRGTGGTGGGGDDMTDVEIVLALGEHVMGVVLPIDTTWNPLTSDADACAVLDKMAETHEVNLVVRHQRPPQADAADYVGCYFGKSDAFLPMSSDARRRVICLAALKAIGAHQ